jgi:archaellum biogenesis ATPase FlaH
VVIVEGMEYLIVQNDFETVLKLLHTLSDYVTTSQSILLVPVNPDALPHHQYVMLRRAFNVITESK